MFLLRRLTPYTCNLPIKLMNVILHTGEWTFVLVFILRSILQSFKLCFLYMDRTNILDIAGTFIFINRFENGYQ